MAEGEDNSKVSLTVDGEKDDCIFNACCCSIESLFMPPQSLACLGQTGKAMHACVQMDQVCCIFPAHKGYALLAGPEPDDVCCIGTSSQSTLIKPHWINGGCKEAVFKSTSTGCCFSKRCAFPTNEMMCAAYGLKCCEFQPFACKPACLANIKHLGEADQAKPVDVARAKFDGETILCAGLCAMCTMYVPNSYVDAFGIGTKSLCCCCDVDHEECMLPRDTADDNLLVLENTTFKCIKPPIMKGGPLCKGVQRTFFCVQKFALPPDKDVPMMCVCCSYKLFGPPTMPEDAKVLVQLPPPPSGTPGSQEMAR